MSARTPLALTASAVAAALALTLTGCSGASPATTKDAPAAPSSETQAPTEAAADKPAEQPAAKPAAPGLNTPVTAGPFEYTVLGIRDIGTTIGEAPLSQDAQGTYLQLDLKVANTGKKSETFLNTYVKLVDAEGRTYDADSTASIYLESTASTWVSGINPGNAVEGPVVFDVPAGTAPVAVKLSGSLFSKATTVNLQ